MNKSILVTRPAYDDITKYFYHWSKEILDMAGGKGFTIYDLEQDKATRRVFESYVSKRKPEIVFLNGHGNADCIAGDGDELIVDSASRLMSAIVYARSCDAAINLGQNLVDNGAHTFIGYKRKFILGYTKAKRRKPLEDQLASHFLQPSNRVVAALLKGHTAQAAHARSKREMAMNFRKMMSSQASFEERYAARWLWSNMSSQVLLGDMNARA